MWFLCFPAGVCCPVLDFFLHVGFKGNLSLRICVFPSRGPIRKSFTFSHGARAMPPQDIEKLYEARAKRSVDIGC